MVYGEIPPHGRYVANALGGYEYKFGGKKKVKRHVIALDAKFTVAGGRYYTPVDSCRASSKAMK